MLLQQKKGYNLAWFKRQKKRDNVPHTPKSSIAEKLPNKF
jgi:hypothetical protein